MSHQRLAPNQISTTLPLEAAREATWRAFAQSGLSDVLIDRDKNIVAGSSGATWKSNGETLIAHFSELAGNTLIEVKAQSHFGGKLDGRRLKKRATKITDTIESVLSAGYNAVSSAPLSPPAPRGFAGVAPIAAPTGENSYALGAPVYGQAMPAKRGNVIMVYAILGLLLIHILSPAAWIYANKTLKDYGELDPGDKKQVKLGRIIGIVGTVVLIFIWGARFSAIGR